VEELDLGESNGTKKVQLVGDRPRGVFAINGLKHLVSILSATEVGEIVALQIPLHSVKGRRLMCHHIRNPYAPSRSKEGMYLGERVAPVGVVSQVM